MKIRAHIQWEGKKQWRQWEDLLQLSHVEFSDVIQQKGRFVDAKLELYDL